MPELDRREFLCGAALAGASLLAGCGRKAVPALYGAPGTDVSGKGSLREHAAHAGLLFGFAVNTQMLREDAAYRDRVVEQSSIMVAENAMKWRALRPAIDRFNFDEADELVTFAETHRIKLRGHNLCWHEALPDWFAAGANVSNARQLLRSHIQTVAGRYAGRMHSWDVVNEAVEVKDGRPDALRNSPWLRLIGTDYIETAFRVARDADPAALLTYNEYGIEDETQAAAEKRAAVLLLLRRLKQRNVPVDAVGVQSHLKAGASASTYGTGLRRFLENCGELGLEVFLTELDVNDRDLPADRDARDLAVAGQYSAYLNAALPSRSVKALLTWGVSDAGTWLNGAGRGRRDREAERPLLFDNLYQPKPAFAAVRSAMDARVGASAKGVPSL